MISNSINTINVYRYLLSYLDEIICLLLFLMLSMSIKIKNIVIPGFVFLLSFYFLYSENVSVNTISFFTHEEQSSYLFKIEQGE